jgi:predicted PurR-regulated permease PerM
MQSSHLNSRTARRIFGTLWGLALLALAVWLALKIPRTVSIFLTAAVIALGVHPVTQWLERKVKRPIAIAIAYLCLLVATLAVAVLVIPTAISQIEVIIANGPGELTTFNRYLDNTQLELQQRLGHGVLPNGATTNLRDVIMTRITAWGPVALASVGPMILSTVNGFVVLVSAIILSIFFLASGERIRSQILSIVPHSREHEVAQLMDEVVNIFGGFVAGQFILCAIVGLSTFVLFFAVGYKFAILAAVVCGIGYAIPFVGILAAHIVGGVLAAPQGWPMVWEVTIIIFLISRVADSILVPKIMAPHVGVSPIAVMFGVFAGGELFGMPGLILGIPAAAMGKVLWRIFVRPWLSRHDVGPRPAEMASHHHHLEPGEREVDIEIHETIIERPASPSPAP